MAQQSQNYNEIVVTFSVLTEKYDIFFKTNKRGCVAVI
jgi:hypothetical protein